MPQSALFTGIIPPVSTIFTADDQLDEQGTAALIDDLIAAGVDMNHVNRLGWTCLMEAIVLSDGGAPHQQIVSQLIAAGADLNLPDSNGLSPLQQAQQRGQSAIAQLLRDAGAH